ncbi:MAG: DUF1838 family protein [Vicinamibacteria bacterium]
MSRHNMKKIALTLALASVLLVPVAAAQNKPSAPPPQTRLDPNKPEDVLAMERKMNCSTEDGKEALYWFAGNVYSRIPGEKDRLLFGVHGFNFRTCRTFSDSKRGPGYRSVSREMLIYTDKDSGDVIKKWKNPWTGEEVDVLDVANDPVSMREPTYAYAADGTPRKFRSEIKDGWALDGGGAARLFYTNPLGGDYQEYVGGTYHAMEFGTEMAKMDDLTDPNTTFVKDRVLTWVRVSKWLSWMKMGNRIGAVVFNTAGLRLDGFDDLPAVVKAEVKANWPTWQSAPPPDDPRPSMTSWDQFKRWRADKK